LGYKLFRDRQSQFAGFVSIGYGTEFPTEAVPDGTRFYRLDEGEWYEHRPTGWRAATYRIISRGGTILTPTVALAVGVWRAPFPCTVVAVKGRLFGDAGTTVNARRNGLGLLLGGDLTLSAQNVWFDGGTPQNVEFAVGDTLDILIQSVSGAPNWVAIQVDFTVP